MKLVMTLLVRDAEGLPFEIGAAPSELEERVTDGRLFLDDRVLRTLDSQA